MQFLKDGAQTVVVALNLQNTSCTTLTINVIVQLLMSRKLTKFWIVDIVDRRFHDSILP